MFVLSLFLYQNRSLNLTITFGFYGTLRSYYFYKVNMPYLSCHDIKLIQLNKILLLIMTQVPKYYWIRFQISMSNTVIVLRIIAYKFGKLLAESYKPNLSCLRAEYYNPFQYYHFCTACIDEEKRHLQVQCPLYWYDKYSSPNVVVYIHFETKDEINKCKNTQWITSTILII
jgi:hypothetical protein